MISDPSAATSPGRLGRLLGSPEVPSGAVLPGHFGGSTGNPMRRFGLFCFNVLLAVGGATVYAWIVRREGMNPDAWRLALLEGGSAGFLSGVAVGLGATVGPRPALSTKKCIWAQAGIAVSSLIGGLVAYLFPRIWVQYNLAIDSALAQRGILRGSGIGLAIGTAWQAVQIYFKRRRPSR